MKEQPDDYLMTKLCSGKVRESATDGAGRQQRIRLVPRTLCETLGISVTCALSPHAGLAMINCKD